MSLDETFDKFQQEWKGVQLTRYDDKLVYRVADSYSQRAAKRANELIDILGLPLIAIPKNTHPFDSFVIQKK